MSAPRVPACANPYIIMPVPAVPDILKLRLTDPRMQYHAGSGHNGKPFAYQKSKFFCDLEALVQFVKDFKTTDFDVLIAGGCSKHHKTLIPLFPNTVRWTMYETKQNQDEEFMHWQNEKENVKVISEYLTEEEAKNYASRDSNRPLLFLIRLDTMQGHHFDTTEDTVKKDLITREKLTKAVRANETYLRFRLPFCTYGQTNKVNYLKPDLILKNVYSRPNSTEITIMVKRPETGDYQACEWDEKTIEEIMSYHNNVQRPLENFDLEASVKIVEEYFDVERQFFGSHGITPTMLQSMLNAI